MGIRWCPCKLFDTSFLPSLPLFPWSFFKLKNKSNYLILPWKEDMPGIFIALFYIFSKSVISFFEIGRPKLDTIFQMTEKYIWCPVFLSRESAINKYMEGEEHSSLNNIFEHFCPGQRNGSSMQWGNPWHLSNHDNQIKGTVSQKALVKKRNNPLTVWIFCPLFISLFLIQEA